MTKLWMVIFLDEGTGQIQWPSCFLWIRVAPARLPESPQRPPPQTHTSLCMRQEYLTQALRSPSSQHQLLPRLTDKKPTHTAPAKAIFSLFDMWFLEVRMHLDPCNMRRSLHVLNTLSNVIWRVPCCIVSRSLHHVFLYVNCGGIPSANLPSLPLVIWNPSSPWPNSATLVSLLQISVPLYSSFKYICFQTEQTPGLNSKSPVSFSLIYIYFIYIYLIYIYIYICVCRERKRY